MSFYEKCASRIDPVDQSLYQRRPYRVLSPRLIVSFLGKSRKIGAHTRASSAVSQRRSLKFIFRHSEKKTFTNVNAVFKNSGTVMEIILIF